MQQSITVNSGVFNQFKINTGFNDLVENIKNWFYSVLGLSEMYPDTEDESEEGCPGRAREWVVFLQLDRFHELFGMHLDKADTISKDCFYLFTE